MKKVLRRNKGSRTGGGGGAKAREIEEARAWQGPEAAVAAARASHMHDLDLADAHDGHVRQCGGGEAADRRSACTQT